MAWNYAGKKADGALAGNAERAVTLNDDYAYLICSGHYVPYYEPPEQEKVDRSRMVKELTRRFFDNAEKDINIRRTYPEIQDLITRFDSLATDPAAIEERRATGALAIGAAVKRMEILSLHVLYYGNAAQPLEADSMPPTQEVDMLYPLFFRDDLTNCVMRRDYQKDIDGVLTAMLSELPKPVTSKRSPDMQNREQLKHIYTNRAIEIGQAMELIDNAGGAMRSMIRFLPTDEKLTVDEHLDMLIATTNKRVGIRSDDVPAYDDAEIRFKAAAETLLNDVRRIGSLTPREEAVGKVCSLLRQGNELVADMAQIRGPRTESTKRYIDYITRFVAQQSS